ncbi:MAG: hypothetical protein JXX14_00865 [Deltaproteobacteria bacterium]|nr:hypothetical protein [Deltaproteobacteria bacterium]
MTCAYKDCPHPIWRDEHCIFHHEDVAAKKDEFDVAFKRYFDACNEDDEIKKYNFRGFVFPDVSFSHWEFLKHANFSKSQFSGVADFTDSQFSGSAFFNWAVF